MSKIKTCKKCNKQYDWENDVICEDCWNDPTRPQPPDYHLGPDPEGYSDYIDSLEIWYGRKLR